MHLRITTKKTKSKTYRYVQIVESYRREDGVPTKRVIAQLGDLSQPLIDSLQAAFKAARSGDALVLRSEVAKMLSGSTLANRRYLDLAVYMDCWRQWGLSTLLEDLAGNKRLKLAFCDVILQLVLQRCCEPSSKLNATRWVPKTALPELLSFDVSSFHNSRIHRDLEALDNINEPLQQRLCSLYSSRDKNPGVMFMDVTDTHFEGIGCPMAELTKTKTEMPHKRCLGIVLLANEHGFPMRWKVVGGKTKDWDAMGGLLDDIGSVDWLKNRPVVFDRAMGNQKNVALLKKRGVHFLTAAHATAIESYTVDLPSSKVSDTEIEATDEAYESDIERVAKSAQDAGFKQVSSNLFAIELGVSEPACERRCADGSSTPRRRRGRHSKTAQHIIQAREIQARFEDDKKLKITDVAASLGISRNHLRHQLALLDLAPAVLDLVLSLGESFPFGEQYLRSLLPLPHDAQLATLKEKLDEHYLELSKPTANTNEDEQIGPLRLVAYFNPQLFVDTRRRTAEHCQKLKRHVDRFNAELLEAKRSRDYNSTYRKFSREVERLKYLDTFDIKLTPITLTSKSGCKISSFQGSITRKEDVWKRRRRYDGFVLLLGHPELTQPAEELVRFYRIKDTVEKDFQNIKSVIKLRPVFSYTDPKVRAHVTVCMLALLLQRTLEQRLRKAGLPLTASACVDILKSCHLNQRRSDGEPLYDITEIDEAQRQVLDALGLVKLADFEYLRGRMSPRQQESTGKLESTARGR